MNINRTCTIELSRDEVAKALTEYVQKHKGYSSKLESWEEVLDYHARDPMCNGWGLRLTWGEKPEPKTEAEADDQDPPTTVAVS